LREDDLEHKVHLLYRKNQRAEAERIQHLAAAFLGGCLIVFIWFRVQPLGHKARLQASVLPEQVQADRTGDRTGAETPMIVPVPEEESARRVYLI